MIGAIMILVLAWSLGGCCRYLLGTGEFVSGFLNGLGVGLDLLPAIIFLVAAFIGFAMGTSLGHHRAHSADHHRRVRCR